MGSIREQKSPKSTADCPWQSYVSGCATLAKFIPSGGELAILDGKTAGGIIEIG